MSKQVTRYITDDPLVEALDFRRDVGSRGARNRFEFRGKVWFPLIAAASRLKVFVINNNDGTVTLSPMGRRGEIIVANLSPLDAIQFLEYVYKQKE